MSARDAVLAALDAEDAEQYAAGAASRDAEVAALQAKIDELEHPAPPTPPEPPPPSTLWGTTSAGSALGPHIVRTYDNEAGPRLWPNTGAAKFTAQGLPVCDSCHPGKSFPDAGWGTDAAKVAAVAAWVGSVPDVPEMRLTLTHEPEAGKQYGSSGAAAFVADQAVFSQTVRAANSDRVHPITIVRTFMGFSIAGHDMSPWCEGDFDELGSDLYNLDQVDPSFALAQKFGKPLCLPETGCGTTKGKTDDQVLAFMQGLVPLVDGRVTWVCWFDAGVNVLDNRPKSTAYWTDVLAQHAG